MKAILLYGCLLFSVTSFSQKVDYKDLIGGIWESKDSIRDWLIVSSYRFIDTLHVIRTNCDRLIFNGKPDTVNYSLKSDSLCDATILKLTSINNNITWNKYYLIRLVDKNSFKEQFYDKTHIKWNDDKSLNKYGNWKRVKKLPPCPN